MQYVAKCLLALFLFCETLLISSFSTPSLPRNNKKWVVVIDPGHGGKDPGCHGLKYKEKDIALAVALKLGHFIEQNDNNVKVIYTRTSDVFIPLNERAEIANRNHADFFICVHCNASPDKSAYGSATYVMGLSKLEDNLAVSKRENSSVLYEKDYKKTYNGFDPNSPEGNILFAMYQNVYLEQSLDLSAKIQKNYETKGGRTNNGVKQARFLVLWRTTMPSLLTEMGFLTNPDEELYIGSQKGQNQVAQSIFLALQEYIDEKEGVTFNANDFKLAPAPVDTVANNNPAAIPDTSTKKVDTIKEPVKFQPVKTPDTTIVRIKPIDKTTVLKTGNMKGLVKELHADTNTEPAKPVVKKVVIPTTPPHIDDTTTIVYKVQVAVSSTIYKKSDPKFKGLADVDVYFDKPLYKYTTGHFYNRDDADKLRDQLRESNFKDAFVVAFKGKNRVKIPAGK